MSQPIPNYVRIEGEDPRARGKHLGPTIFLGVPIIAMIVIVGAGSLQLFADVKHPEEQIKFIADEVKELVDSGILSADQGNSLMAKLDTARSKLDANNVRGAISQFQSFINEVNGFMKAGQLQKVQGERLIDTTGNIFEQLGFKSVEMVEMDRGLHATKSIEVKEDHNVALAFTKNASPDARLDLIEFKTVPGVTSVSLDVNVSNQTPADLPRPNTDDFLLFMDISLKGAGADFGSENAYSISPKITFQADKGADGNCQDVQLFLLDETTKEWESKPVSKGQDNGYQCTYEGTVPHFSTYAIGVKRPNGGGGVGSGGSGAGGGPAIMMDSNRPTITAYFWDPEFPTMGKDLTVNAVIMDDVIVQNATLFYYGIGGNFREAHSVSMQNLHVDWYTVAIPGTDVKAPGIYFWIVAVDSAGNSVKLDTKTVRIQDLHMS